MVVERISSREVVTQNYFDPMDVVHPIVKVTTRVLPEEYSSDTIQQAKDAAKFVIPMTQFSPIDLTVSRPILETPHLDVKKLPAIDKELKSFVDPNVAEIGLLFAYIACMKVQREHSETNVALTLDTIDRKQKSNKIVTQELFAKQDALISQNKISNVAKWINWILYGALAVVGVSSIVLTALTAGVAFLAVIATVIALSNATLSIGAGATTIFRGVLDYKSKKLIGELEEKKFERNLNTQKIKTGMEEMQQSSECVAESWKQLTQVVNNWHQAALIKQ